MSTPRKFIDLTHPLDSETQIYPLDPLFSSNHYATHEKDGYCVHQLSLGTHTGTHIDAPYHFVADGQTIDQMPLETFVSEAVIVDLSEATLRTDEAGHERSLRARERITWEDLTPYAALMKPGRMFLVNTGWSKAHYKSDKYLDHPYFAPGVASELVARGIKLVGTDTLNPDETPPTDGAECAEGFGFHEVFLGAGGTIVENLTNLEELIHAQKEAPSSKWMINVVPLKLTGADGSPVRAFAYTT